jgi:ribose transport system substrate-binding protein
MSRVTRVIATRCVGAGLVLLSVVLLAACGGSSSSSSSAKSAGSGSSSSGSVATTTPAGTGSGSPSPIAVSASGGCGTVPAVAPNDPTGVLRSLGSQYVAAYQGFRDYPLVKSPWENWKPAHKSGWNVQIVWQPLINSSTTGFLKGLQDELKASGKVATMQVQTMDSVTDVPQQLQMIQTAIQRKPDLLIVFPAVPNAVVPLIAQAAKAGIPTISEFESTPSKYAVSVNLNFYLAQALPSAGVLGLMGGKGSVLEVHGIPGIAGEIDTAAAWAEVLSRCPHVQVAGKVFGQYSSTLAKSLVQQFLATHPAGVQGVFDAGVMGAGVLGAFEQTGRTPPPLDEPGATQGAIAYFHDHPSYSMVATLTPTIEVGQDTGKVALRMLEGDGVKINTILSPSQPLVTKANLAQVWDPSFKEGSPVSVSPSPGQWLPNSYLDGLFVHKAS